MHSAIYILYKGDDLGRRGHVAQRGESDGAERRRTWLTQGCMNREPGTYMRYMKKDSVNGESLVRLPVARGASGATSRRR